MLELVLCLFVLSIPVQGALVAPNALILNISATATHPVRITVIIFLTTHQIPDPVDPVWLHVGGAFKNVSFSNKD
jgi:hypothetical protein